MRLHEALDGARDDVLRRWRLAVAGTVAPASTPTLELIDHIPEFLAAIVAALRVAAGLPTSLRSPEETETARVHGEQRFRLGFSLDAVVREYGALGDAIIEAARHAGADITFAELHVVSNAIVGGIAHAVSQYTRHRDLERTRQTNEHFAFIAHELRNPLTTARGSLCLLRHRGGLPAGDRAVAALERSLSTAIDLVDHSLADARAASGIELRRVRTTLRELCAEAELEVICEADVKDVSLQVTVETDEQVDVDVRLVRSALGNIVRNAVKYTHPGGVVELRGRVADGYAVFEVADHCGGLEPGMVESIFAPFVRVDRGQPGFGLGLAIAKQAVEAHGGSIRVQDVPGTGCMFVVELPLVAGA
jgi:signal transduction histidine kinase